MPDVAFPYAVDGRGRTAEARHERHVRDLIEQVLFTSPGERVNRPTFGTGLLRVVFAPAGDELVAAVRFQVQGALQQWLADVVHVEGVEVHAQDSTIEVVVRYVVKRTQTRRVDRFRRSL